LNEYIKIVNIKKTFGENTVLFPFNLTIKPGEFHAFVGENGAGKSTLINLVTGVYEPDEGEIIVEGHSYKKMSPALSKKLGIQVVHQELSLNPSLTVAENFFLGEEITKGSLFLNKKAMKEETGKFLKEAGLTDIDPEIDVRSLNLAQQQMLEFARALYQKPKVLILDEATSALNDKQVELMFNKLRMLKKEGLSILFVSHRLHELFELCDIMTVLKDGTLVVTEEMKDFDQDRLVSLMTGRSITDLFPKKREFDSIKNREDIIKAEKLCTKHLTDLSFTVKKGEILGIGGLAGQGQQDVLETLFGMQAVKGGSVTFKGNPFPLKNPAQAMKKGFAYLPAERKTQSLFISHSIKFNMSFVILDKLSNWFGTVVKKREEEENAESVKRLQIKLADINQIIGELSGGNQQKVVLAKWLNRSPEVLLLNEPTRGIDVGTKKEIYELLSNLSKEGVSIILVSSDTLELIGLCDRVIVMYEHTINGEITSEELSEETLVHASVFRKEVHK